ncbi:MAG: PEP-CTERM sorting domain-containing protein [Verrucomicrobiota bacterium]
MKIHQPCAIFAPSIFRFFARFSGTLGILALVVTGEGATVVQVDFNDNGDSISAPPVAGDPGGNWNVIPLVNSGSVANLTDFQTGGGSGVSMTLTNFSQSDSPPNGDSVFGWTSTAWVDIEAGADGVQVVEDLSTPGPPSIVFGGLNPGSLYRVEVVAVVPFGQSIDQFDGSSFEVNGSAATRNSNPGFPFDSTDWNLQLATFFQAWMIWDDVVPSSGEITVDLIPSGAGIFEDVTIINAIRLEEFAIPEPSASILLLFGGLMGLSRRIRRRR